MRIALAGAGLVGRQHAAALAAAGLELAVVADPDPAARDWAAARGVDWVETVEAALARAPDGLIAATPTALHARHAGAAIAAGVPVLVEKPLAESAAAAAPLVAAAEAAGVPVLVGHHRRHNPQVARAKAAIEAGRLGRIVAVHGFCWLPKPGDYFDAPWRRAPGGGPVMINLIHDVDLLRHLCGEIVAVRAEVSNAVRGLAVEDSAVALLRFANGALGTLTLSDAIAAPWSWEMTAGENPAYPRAQAACAMIGGTLGSLSLPDAALWSAEDGAPHWWAPLKVEAVAAPPVDPLVAQARHFAEVIRGAAPLVSGAEGLRSLRVVEAVLEAAASGAEVRLE
ncbi:MAG: Gfo/Idh/MocA family oxidoreductase [Pseudomonadota bacterium]